MIQVACIAIIKNGENNVLMIEQKTNDGYKFFLPGGKIEENESTRDSLIREIKEELNIIVEIGELVGFSETNYSGKDMLNLYYLANTTGGNIKIQETEKILSYRYSKITELSNYNIIKWIKEI